MGDVSKVEKHSCSF